MTYWGVEAAFTKAARAAGLRLTPHSARHGYAIATMRLGAQQHDVMTLMGHRSAAAFHGYGRLLASERARHTYDKFIPVDNAKPRRKA
jgi:integrase